MKLSRRSVVAGIILSTSGGIYKITGKLAKALIRRHARTRVYLDEVRNCLETDFFQKRERCEASGRERGAWESAASVGEFTHHGIVKRILIWQ